MQPFHIIVDVDELAAAGARLSPDTLTRLLEALYQATDLVRDRWVEYAAGKPLPDGRAVPGYLTPQYQASIGWTITGPFSTEVFSRAPEAERIEHGRPERQLKRMLDTSHKVKIARNGRRYLVIPFRHAAFNKRHEDTGVTATNLQMMSRDVHRAARAMSHSQVKSSSRVQVASQVGTRKPLFLDVRRYQWGDRLPPGLAPKLAARHKTDPYAGMVKFQEPRRGGSKETNYLTFRTMTDRSPGWVVPAQPGLHVAKTVADEMKPIATRLLTAALEGKP